MHLRRAVATDQRVSIKRFALRCVKFGGVGRRFQVAGEFVGDSKVLMVDDHGHHPF